MKFYRQTTEYTGAPASLLMALNHLAPDKFPLNQETEFNIWLATANLPTRSSSIYGLAVVAQQAGVNTELYVGKSDYEYPDYRFKRYKKVEIEQARFTSSLHLKEAQSLGVPVHVGNFSLDFVREQLEAGKLVLLRVNAGVFREQRAVSKYALVHGLDDSGDYLVMDPKEGALRVSQEQMKEAFTTLSTKKKRDHRMLLLSA